MTDEEMAEEKYCKGCKWRIEQCLWAWRKTNGLKEPNEKNCSCKEVPAFLAGLKAKTQWYTPDVPTRPINKVVFGYVKYYNSKLPCLVGWNGEWWYDAGTWNKKVKLIAWCEIPTFDKE